MCSQEKEVDKIERWAAHDGLLLVSETVFKLLLEGCELDEDEDQELTDEDEEPSPKPSKVNKKGERRLSVGAQQLCTRLLLDPFIVLIDEAHRVQNPNSKMTKVSV